MPSIFPPLLAFGVSLAMSQPAVVGRWHSFTNKDQVNVLVAHQGRVFAGTKGGIRRIEPATMRETEYDNLDGLLDCWISGFAALSDGNLWAVSRSGYLYRQNGERWEVHGRSYASLRWIMIDRSVLGIGRFLFLGSEKGLSIFDTRVNAAQANITRFGASVDVPVQSMIRRADTLVLGTPDGAYKIGLDTLNPVDPGIGYGSLSDPDRWVKVLFAQDTAGAPARQFGALAFFGDSLATYPAGTVLSAPRYVEALGGADSWIGNNAYPTGWVRVRAAAFTPSELFLGGDFGIFYSKNPMDSVPILGFQRSGSRFPWDTVGGIAASGQGVWAQTIQGMQRLNADSGGFLFENTPVYPSAEIITRGLKNVVSGPNGDVYVGSWGAGVVRIREGGNRGWNASTDPCLFQVVENYPVVHAISNVSGPHLFFSLFKAEDVPDHQLVHLDVATERLTCLDSNASGGHPHSVRVFGDSLVGVGSDLGVAFFGMQAGAFAPVMRDLGLWKLDGQANETWDLAADRWGRPWAVIGDRLAFADSVGDTAHTSGGKFEIVAEFPGVECRNLEADPRQGLWVGCSNGLFRVEPSATGIAKMVRYGLDEGLLNLSIRDISVNPVNGQVWVATDRGLSMLESEAQPPIPALNSVRVFPNPFQARHAFALFDNLPTNSTLRIHNGAGDVVRIFRPRDLMGNQAQWDGKNQDGRAVSPGVYLYSVVAGTAVKRGKIIVAR